MNRLLAAASLSLLLTAPHAALAQPPGPPPLRVKVLMASSPHLDAAARDQHEAFLQTLSTGGPGGGWFELLPTGLDTDSFEHCTISAQDPRTCVSRLLTASEATGATVVVLAFGEGERARWMCVGTGARPTSQDRQLVQFDLGAGLDATSPQRMEARATAAGCITSAGAESGW
jgi:hypothetical protein